MLNVDISFLVNAIYLNMKMNVSFWLTFTRFCVSMSYNLGSHPSQLLHRGSISGSHFVQPSESCLPETT
jgi:hypothetical protein